MKRLLIALAFVALLAPSSCGKEPDKTGSTYDNLFGNKDGEQQEEDLTNIPVVTVGTSTLELPYVISDHMVLQQNATVNIWGKATPLAEVTVEPSWTSESFKGRVNREGRWIVAVTTPAASFEARTLKISDSQRGSRTVSDVLIGEVWMSAGQSNMEHRIGGFGTPGADNYQPIKDVDEELKDADLPWFRYFKCSYQLSDEPQFQTKSASWYSCTASSAPNIQAIAFFFARKLGRDLNVPIGIIGCAYGGSRIEAWMSLNSLQKFPAADWKDISDLGKKPGDTDKQIPAQIYNGMVLPVINYTVKGILWYQGESNRDNYTAYPKLQQEMIRDWRALKADSDNIVPFYCVQLASNHTSDDLGWARMQEAQLGGMELIPNSGIIAAYDCGGPTIHYPDKRTPAERLALLAESRDYGFTAVNPLSPRFESMVIDGDKVVVTLSNAAGLHLKEGETEILYGQVATALNVWSNAEVTIQGDKLVFRSPNVTAPAHVRFCYSGWCVGGNVYNAAGLPVFPFNK